MLSAGIPEALRDAAQFPDLAAQSSSASAARRPAPQSPPLPPHAAATHQRRPAPLSFAFVAERGHTTLAFPTLAEASARGKSGGSSGAGGAGGAAKGGAWGRPGPA